MFHDRGQRHWERLGNLAHGHPVLFGQPRQDRAAGRVGQGRERGIQFVMSIVNHVVKYIVAARPVKGENPESAHGEERGCDGWSR